MKSLFNQFTKLKVLIIGDVMIDDYFQGTVKRISPEAPVPIVTGNSNVKKLGGAANVALNVKALGATPILCSIIGEDQDAVIFERLLNEQKISTHGILKKSTRKTTVKTRIIGNGHQMLRLDSEQDTPLDASETNDLFEKAKEIALSDKIDVLIFQDYDKGVITKELIEKIIPFCQKHNILTAVDPKKRNFLNYKNVTLFKPNLKEIEEGLNVKINPKDKDSIFKHVTTLTEKLNPAITFITLSEHGVYISNEKECHSINAHLRNITDVSGAGDTVISVASLLLALHQPIKLIAEIANLAGGVVCEKAQVEPIDKETLLAEIIEKIEK